MKKISRSQLAPRTLAVYCLSPLAMAHANPVAAIDSAAGGARLEEVIVTAEKRQASIQDVPIAVTALFGDSLQQQGINDVAAIAVKIPNFDFGESFGAAKLSIRGISYSNLSTGAEGSVAYNLNGVYVSRPAAQLGSFFDVDRVEVLRGPQGTLYGRNATGGAVNIYTAKPGEYWSGFAQLSLENYEHRILEGAVGGPLGDNLGVRLAVFDQQRDGYGKNIVTGKDVDTIDASSARATFAWTPSSVLSIDLIADTSHQKDASRATRTIAQRGLTGEEGVSGEPILGVQLGGTALLQQFDIASDIQPRYSRRSEGLTLDASWDVSDSLTVRSLTAYRSSEFTLNSDLDGTDVALSQIFYDEESVQYSQEFNVHYSGDRLQWTAGAYIFDEEIDGVFWTPGAPPQDPGNFLAAYAAGGTISTRAYAVFGQLEYALTDQLAVILGGRFSSEEKEDEDLYTDFVTDTKFLEPADLDRPNPPLSGPFEQSERWDSFTPKVGVNYHLNQDTLLYGSVSEGFKAGVFNLGATSVIPVGGGEVALSNPAVDPESVWAYEVGVKSDLLDQSLRLNSAAFYYDYSDLQLTKIVGLLATLTNAAKAEIYGLEVEAEYQASESLNVQLTGGWLHARFSEFDSTDPGRPTLGIQDLSGNQLPQAPEFSVGLGVEYSVFLPRGVLKPSLQANWRSRNYFDEFNIEAISQAEHTKVDLSLSYADESGFELVAFVRNLTDEETLETAYQSSGRLGYNINGFLSPPRTYGIRARYTF